MPLLSDHFIGSFKGFDWTEIPFNIKVLDRLPPDTPHNHSFQIPGNDKRLGMNGKILPHCLLINLRETSKFDIYFAICGYYMKILYPLPNYCLWTNLLASQLRKNITTFFCFNKVKNAFCLYYFLASHLNSLNGDIFHNFNIDNSQCPVF